MRAKRHGVPSSACRSKFGIVHDMLNNRHLTPAEKRTILASCAPDAPAVVDAPAPRSVDEGTSVGGDDLLDALKSIDANDRRITRFRTISNRRYSSARRGPRVSTRWLSRIAKRKNSDDDDPPPCPAAASVARRPSLIDACAPTSIRGRAIRSMAPAAA